MSTVTTKATPAKSHYYTVAIPIDNEGINISCTHDMAVARIAKQLHPESYIGYQKEQGACFEWREPEADVKDAIKEAQRRIGEHYWKSKNWSKGVSEILARPNPLSEFGEGLYKKMLESEKFKRYRYKKQLKQLEELL